MKDFSSRPEKIITTDTHRLTISLIERRAFPGVEVFYIVAIPFSEENKVDGKRPLPDFLATVSVEGEILSISFRTLKYCPADLTSKEATKVAPILRDAFEQTVADKEFMAIQHKHNCAVRLIVASHEHMEAKNKADALKAKLDDISREAADMGIDVLGTITSYR